MTKYLPKDSGYKQLYLINKFEKNIMETALSNMKNDERKSDTITAPKKDSQETQTPSPQDLNSHITPKEQQDSSVNDSGNNVPEISFREIHGKADVNQKHIQEAFNILLKQAKRKGKKMNHSNVNAGVKSRKIKEKKKFKNIRNRNVSVKDRIEPTFLIPPKGNKIQQGLIYPTDTETFYDWSV